MIGETHSKFLSDDVLKNRKVHRSNILPEYNIPKQSHISKITN